ncbi:MAG TPA: PstS family phosphate ABC transporter substrate-binding protein [Longimicrobiales bacterium]|nr:PstS family phosphate ABC transporter substrate-binding protein [Longimicrobiales bacterium]
MTRMRFSVLAAALLVAACGGGDAGSTEGELGGAIQIDGSSTVYPITEAVAEEFGIEHGGAVQVTIGFSGTGGGFKRFCAGEIEISNASRPIKQSEIDLCEQNGITYMELPVGIDALAVVVNPANTAVECLTVAELRKLWEPGSTVSRWSELRAGLPDEPIKLYGPGTNSGTFDYFTEAVMGESGASRGDYTASEDDNPLVQGVAGDVNALAYFGFAYYSENRETLRALGIDNGQGCIMPNPETAKNGQYAPLSRPMFVYVTTAALQRPEVAEFLRFYMTSAPELVTEVGYVPLEPAEYQANISKIGQGG